MSIASNQFPPSAHTLSCSGDTPEVIGEASILLAQTCFPNDSLGGNKGHSAVDVTCEYRLVLLVLHF